MYKYAVQNLHKKQVHVSSVPRHCVHQYISIAIGEGTENSVYWKGRGNKYIQFVRVVYCKLPTNGKQLPAFPHEAVPGIEPRPQRWEARVLPLCHRGPFQIMFKTLHTYISQSHIRGDSISPIKTPKCSFFNMQCGFIKVIRMKRGSSNCKMIVAS